MAVCFDNHDASCGTSNKNDAMQWQTCFGYWFVHPQIMLRYRTPCLHPMVNLNSSSPSLHTQKESTERPAGVALGGDETGSVNEDPRRITHQTKWGSSKAKGQQLRD